MNNYLYATMDQSYFTTCYHGPSLLYHLLPWIKPTLPPATMDQAYFTACYRALAYFHLMLPWPKPTLPPATMGHGHGEIVVKRSLRSLISCRLKALQRFKNFLHLHEWRATFLWFQIVPSGSISIIKKSF